ncbi:MAG TPA: undecaprenyl-phosphate glucose phosphotransferase [Polyangiales bacterium]|jgi:exopolysaccharide biosynthesis polyprenyl glycosylphosphotransferase
MLRKRAHTFVILMWMFDMAVLAISFAAAYGARFFLPWLAPHSPDVSPIDISVQVAATAIAIWTLCFYALGLYGSRRGRSAEVLALAKATLLGTLLLVFTQYFSGNARYSRGVILLFTAISFGLLSLTRILARELFARARARGINARRAIIVGANDLAAALVKRLEAHPEFGVRVCAVLGANDSVVGGEVAGHRITGRYDQLHETLAATGAEEVYIAVTASEHEEVSVIHAALATETADVRVVPDVLALITLRGGVEDMDGLPLVHLTSGPLVGFDAWLKRALDLVVASIALIVVSPVMLVCAIVVKISSPGPIIFRQERMGLDGRLFRILKFRSMPMDAEAASGAVWAKAGERRAFPFGAIMRKYSLDELPQLFNVLKGDMSLVGPRPERPVFIQELKHLIPRYNLRHKIKAGITGLAQVEGWRGDTSIEKRIECDLRYIENWSLWLDIKILVRTGVGGFLSRNAY